MRIRKIFSFFLLFVLLNAKGQNLVPNPSFEKATDLPCSPIIAPSSSYSNSMRDWTIPTSGTSDIFSTSTSTDCYGSCLSTYPFRIGEQIPRTGTNMSGFFAYGTTTINSYREYIQVKLASPLVVGKSYYAEIYVSAAETASYGCNNIGMYFSDSPVSAADSYTFLPYTPQIKCNEVLTDTENWSKIAGIFVATSAAEYITIGNFSDDASTSTILKYFNFLNMGAYYFIDDVSVTAICDSKDSIATICKGSSIELDFNTADITHWVLENSPSIILSNTSAVEVTPEVTTTYLAYYACGAIARFEVVVLEVLDVHPVKINEHGPLCEGAATVDFIAEVNIPEGETITYQWYLIHPLNLLEDPVGINSPVYSYSPVIENNNQSVKVVVTVSTGCGTGIATSNLAALSIIPAPVAVAGEDIYVQPGDLIQLDGSGGEIYNWSPGTYLSNTAIDHPSLRATQTITYVLKVSDGTNTCSSTDDVTVFVIDSIRIPNVITVNGDGMNDDWEIKNIEIYPDVLIDIYNRWGNLVWKTSGYSKRWDGTNFRNGQPLPEGTYFYMINLLHKKDDSLLTGWVQIIR